MLKRLNPYYQGPASDHFDGERFFVPGHVHDKSRKDLMKMARDRRATWPRRIPSPFHAKPDKRLDNLRSTLIGHASFLVQAANLNLLIDPVFAKRASPFGFVGPSRANPPGIAFHDLPPIDAVLITHSHYDHMDKAALRALATRHKPLFICPLGVDVLMHHQRVPVHEVQTLDWWQSTELGPLTIHAVPTYHWSARGIGDRRKTLWCSFAIETPSGLLYHLAQALAASGIAPSHFQAFRPGQVLEV